MDLDNRESLPLLHSNTSSNWLYLLPEVLEGKTFYNYETGLGVLKSVPWSIKKANQNWQANHHIDHMLPACRKAANGLPPWDWQVF